MSIEDVLIAIGITVIAALVVSVLGWIFRRQVAQALLALDMSTATVFGWVMAFIMLGVIIVFPLIDIETPTTLRSVFPVIVGLLIASSVWQRR